MSLRLSYLTMRARFLIVLAVIPVGLPSRDDADIAIAFSEYQPDYFAVVFAERDEAPFAVIAPRILYDKHITAEYFRRFTKADAVLLLVVKSLKGSHSKPIEM
jgi:hypothetical protein